jgi:RES domain-containing protein
VQSAWRIVKARRAATAFDGEGARLYGGRWTSAGRPAVYASSTVALAVLEMLVHLGDVAPLPAYVLFELSIPEELISVVDVGALPHNWPDSPPPAALQAIGDEWLDSGRSAALRVPSAVARIEFNYLLSPSHADFRRIGISPQRPFDLDARLPRRGA